ncbi:alpha/beta-hydrolase [Flammula alnicola]|nr:alpha/beta-hydrolase [Flammula alnicola]
MHLFLLTCLSIVIVSVATTIKSSDGTDIFANAAGNSSNPSLIFVHGFALSGSVFEGLFHDRRLLKRFYLVSYDMRGHGRSGKPNNTDSYASKLFADDFDAVRRTFHLKSPIFVGWSYGASVASDIFTYLDSGSISGFVSAAGIPYLGLTGVNTPLSESYLPGFFSKNDVVLGASSKIAFVDSCFANPANVPVRVKWSWLGSTTLQFPAVSFLVASRIQDPTNLYAAGSQGFPLLMLRGTADAVLLNDVIISQIEPHFTNAQVYTIQDGSHALFYDNQDEFVRVLIGFATKIFQKDS